MFNKSQIEAICHNKGPAIVLAGPGSGKTTVITHRVKNLIETEGVPPENILVVTFTKAAAVHMQHKFMEIMKQNEINSDWRERDLSKVYPVTFGTFHSVFYRILRMSYSYGSDSIVSDRMKYDFLKEIVIRLRIDVGSLPDFIQNISSEISKVKGNMYDVDSYEPSCCKKEIFNIVFNEYESTLEAERKIDFEDMLLKCHKLLLERQDILHKWQEIFKYILIDEFQDINKIQYEIVKMLALPENNLFIVGDDDQSIYGFRGSCPEIMFQFKEDYNDASQILLDINYRSTPEIVQLSGNLIRHNNNRFDKKIISGKVDDGFGENYNVYEKNNTGKTDIRKFRNQGEELKFLSQQIKQHINNGVKPEDIAILVRNNSQISGVADFLKNEMLDTRIKKNKNIYQGMVAKDVIAYVRAALCGDAVPLRENENLIYILNKPPRLISRQVIGDRNMDFQELKQVYCHNREILRNIEQLQFHLGMIRGLNPVAALTYIRYGVGYENYLQQYAIENKIKLSGLLKQFDNLQNMAAEFDTLQDLLKNIDSQNEDNNEEIQKGVNIITMHGAKGLEFRVVFIIDANQGIIPSSKAVRERDFQEERRVFYVAMTRAAEYLNIYCVAESLGCPMEMSMFVEETLDNEK